MTGIRPFNMSSGLTIAGVILIGYAIFMLVGGAWIERRDRRNFAAVVADGVPFLALPARQRLTTIQRGTNRTPAAMAHRKAARIGLGILGIERLGISVLVRPGAGTKELATGAGWIPGTARPGEDGNVGIAGHRDTFFRNLRDARVGDKISLKTPGQTKWYIIRELQIVDPTDTSALYDRPIPSLTLVTCYPFDFVGAAPQRFLVIASAIESQQTALTIGLNALPKRAAVTSIDSNLIARRHAAALQPPESRP